MEKFGIFNLLSALSSLLPEQTESEPKTETEKPDPPQPQKADTNAAGVFTAEERKTRAAEMLERHEKIAQRIGRR